MRICLKIQLNLENLDHLLNLSTALKTSPFNPVQKNSDLEVCSYQ